jgi:hypothetical protein
MNKAPIFLDAQFPRNCRDASFKRGVPVSFAVAANRVFSDQWWEMPLYINIIYIYYNQFVIYLWFKSRYTGKGWV